MNEQAYYVDTPWTWRERLRCRLFPSRHCELPPAPATYQDCVVVTTVITFSVLDRVRMLWSGTVIVQTKTVTEHAVGGTMTSSVAYPSLRRKHPVAVCAVDPVLPQRD